MAVYEVERPIAGAVVVGIYETDTGVEKETFVFCCEEICCMLFYLYAGIADVERNIYFLAEFGVDRTEELLYVLLLPHVVALNFGYDNLIDIVVV